MFNRSVVYRFLLTLFLLAIPFTVNAVTVITDTLRMPNGVYEQYWLQIPDNYNPLTPPPLLIGFHAYGGDYLELANVTLYDSLANAYGWLAVAITGLPMGYAGPTHWWCKRVQNQLDIVLDFISQRYPFDTDRMYSVGGSMGGAAGMEYNNHHLDPTGYMMAGSVGGSGIIDLARRQREQGINYSMRYEFGPLDSLDEINFEYKRNSGVVFWDTTNSMHYNLKWMPLRQASGVLERHYVHDTDLVALYGREMRTYEVFPCPDANHGWMNLNDTMQANWLRNIPGVIRHPTVQNVAGDEVGRWYDVRFNALRSDTNMARAHVVADSFQQDGIWKLKDHQLTLMRNASSVKLFVQGRSLQFNTTITNRDTLPVSVQIQYEEMPATPAVINIEPPIPYTFNATNWTLSLPNVPLQTPISVRVTYTDNVSESLRELPGNFTFRTSPNPFNSTTMVTINSQSRGLASFTLYDVEGREVRKLPNRFLNAPGSITFSLPAGELSSGTYFLQGKVGATKQTQRLTILR